MKFIYKYELEITDHQEVMMPAEAELLSVGYHDDVLCLWAMCYGGFPPEGRLIEIIGTGNPVHCDMGVDRKFIGTAVGPFVAHVFEWVT